MEAMADVEELLQINEADQISLEARFCNSNNQIISKRLIPLIRIQERGPIVAEGRILFRFPEIARDFADILVSEGKTCRAVTDNWGAAITAKIPMTMAESAYQAIKEATLPTPAERVKGIIKQAINEMKDRIVANKINQILNNKEEASKLFAYIQEEFAREGSMPEIEDIQHFLKQYLHKLSQETSGPENQDEFFSGFGK
jgi:hypothetical protein